MAIKNTFGEELAKEIYVSSTKGQTGHALGAAGGIEAIVCAKAIETVSRNCRRGGGGTRTAVREKILFRVPVYLIIV